MGALIATIAAHAILGVALAAVVWLAGVPLALRLPGRHLANAYAGGLLVVLAMAFASLLSVLLLPVAVAAVGALVWSGLRALDRERIDRSTTALLAALPGTLGFALALGLFQHGPTSSRDSNAFGDLVFYVAELTSAARSVVPFRDLSLYGFDHTYVQSAPALIGGVLDRAPGFDAFAFYTATLPSFFFAALAIGAGPIRRPLLAAGLVAGALAYPTWLSESPPVALAAPVAFSFCSFAGAPALSTAALAAAVLVLTKGIGIVPLGALVGVAAATGTLPRASRAMAVALGALAVAAIALVSSAEWLTELLALEFLPRDALDGLWDQLDSRSTQALAPALLVAGHLLLVVGTARLRELQLLAAVIAGVAASWFVGGHASDVALLLAVLLLALELRRLEPDRTTERLLVAAAACLLVGAWFREVAGVGTAAVLLTLAVLALAGGFAVSGTRSLALVAAATLAAGAAAGFLRLDPASPPLTRDHAALVREVADRVPSDGLVYTSLTGERITSDEGWNYYSAVSGRQQYVAGWANSKLRVRPEDRERRLALNRRVLRTGTPIVPGRPAYAVIRRDEQPPPGSRRLYVNRLFALYELRVP